MARECGPSDFFGKTKWVARIKRAMTVGFGFKNPIQYPNLARCA
jgi:hypothetical protein